MVSLRLVIFSLNLLNNFNFSLGDSQMNYKKEVKKFIARGGLFSYRQSDKFETVAYLRGNLAQAKNKSLAGLRKTAAAFLRENANLFGKNSFAKLEISLEASDSNGGANLVYQQYHSKSLVYAGGIRFHFNKKGILDTVNSRLNPTLASVPLEPKITADEAAKKAERKLRPANLIEVVRTLYYYYEGKTYLVWEVHLRGLEPSERGVPPFWIVYVDAVTGKVIDYYDNIQTIMATGIGTGYYSNNGNPQNIKVSDTGSTYQLLDATRTLLGGPQIMTYDAPEQKISEDTDNNWAGVSVLPRNDSQGAEIDVHVYAGEVADYLKLHFGRNSYDGHGGDMAANVHAVTQTPEIAWWWGSSANFGDGSAATNSKFDFLCSKDVVAHEFGHGVTNTATQELQYSHGESGALHESFSDFMAALMTQDWLMCEQCWLPAHASNPPAPALRNMMDPTNGAPSNFTYSLSSAQNGCQPAHYSQYVGGDPHINSGIINQFFYLLCAGGTNPVSGIHVDGIGEAVVETIFYQALTVNLLHNNTANFLDFRQAMIDACIDLYSPDIVKLTQVKKAFHAVGIGPDIYIRDQFWDAGAEPNPNMWFDSPDIMNFYGLPTIDMADLTLSSSVPLEAGQINNAYARLQNRGYAGPNPYLPSPINLANPIVYVYLTPGTSFGPFSSWIYVGTMDPGVGYLWFAPGMTPSLDVAIPKEWLPPVGHYCMIALVNDSYDPAPDPAQIATISDYLDYISNTNNVAFRNMDVVDYQPNVFKWHEFTIGHMGSAAVSYHISFDLEQFVPGAEFYVRGPRTILSNAKVRGLKLIERDRNDNVYEVLTGDEIIKQQQFAPSRKDVKNPVVYGFEDLRTNKAFKVEIGYKMPSEEAFKKLGERRLQEGFEFSMRQFYEGKLLGRVGLKFRQDHLKRSQEKRKKSKAVRRQSGPRKSPRSSGRAGFRT
jgi:Zn-dependent metalloprotease